MAPTFLDSAQYFERRAKMERSPERREEFNDAANFYRTLAKIVPTFPPGFRTPAPIKPNGSIRADKLLAWAEECRAISQAMRDPYCKGVLERLAVTYEEAAKAHL